jgi:cysteine synthase A
VPDAASIGAARVLSAWTGRSCGGSTGTNMWAAAAIIGEMAAAGMSGAVVTLLCDSGERYRSTCLDDGWLAANRIDTAAAEAAMRRFLAEGVPLVPRGCPAVGG